MLTTEPVEWTDLRVVALHAALATETGAIYRVRLAKLPRSERVAALESIDFDPATIEVTLLALDDELPVATGAVRRSIASETEWEVKHVFVVESHRGQGISRSLMLELESQARENGATTMVLQTGDLQASAIGLYSALGYEPCEAYPPYGHYPGELTFRKVISTGSIAERAGSSTDAG